MIHGMEQMCQGLFVLIISNIKGARICPPPRIETLHTEQPKKLLALC